MSPKRASNFIYFLNILVPQMDAKIEPMPAHKSQETPQGPPRERQDTPQEHPMTPGTVLDLFLSDFRPIFVPFWIHLTIILHPFGLQLRLILEKFSTFFSTQFVMKGGLHEYCHCGHDSEI